MARAAIGPKCRCGEVLVKPASGPMPRYCSPPCRRTAEYELRRQQSLLLRAEKAWQDARLRAATEHGEAWQQKADWWAGEVALLEDNLEQTFILEDQDDPRAAS